jgi:nitrogen-specific signal transduction histidine kinase
MSDDTPADEAAEGPRRGIRGAARRLLEDAPTLDEAKELLGTVLDGSDRARSELVRMVGREVRTYLEGLGLPDGLKHIAENYSLEVNASLRLKPLKKEPASDE